MEELNRRAYMYKQDKLVTQLLYVREQQRRLQALGHRSRKIGRYFHQPVGFEPVRNEEAALLYLDRQNYFQAELIMEEIVMGYQVEQKTPDPAFSHIITHLVALYKRFDCRIQAIYIEDEDMVLIAKKSVISRIAQVDSEELCAHVYDAGGFGFHGAFDSEIALYFAALHNACSLARRAFDCEDSVVSNSHQNLGDGQGVLYGVRSSFHLHTATENGSIDMVKLLLARGFDIEASMNLGSGETPLHKAAVGGSMDILMHLITKGANIEARRRDQKTPLILAASHGKLDAVQYLLERGAHIDSKDVDGCTALHWPTIIRNTDMIKLLLGFQAGLEARGNPGMTALHCAARLKSVGAVECIEVLIDGGLDIDAKDDFMETPLHKACQRGNHEAVKTLLRRGAATSPVARKGTPLHEAVNIWNLHDRISTIHTLVNHVCRRDLNIQRSCDARTPLHAAVRNLRTFGKSNMVVLEYLWSHGADVNLKDGQSMSSLDYAEDFEDAKELMKQEQQVAATNILHLIEKPE
ncbi:MAG: hypothetical protein LQ337_007762 [Flavoplaca oasis]|nr:MAG: hypothetical protein LQ337_007762 [Flavoplaca oasis]